jgi:hypothetical protein
MAENAPISPLPSKLAPANATMETAMATSQAKTRPCRAESLTQSGKDAAPATK